MKVYTGPPRASPLLRHGRRADVVRREGRERGLAHARGEVAEGLALVEALVAPHGEERLEGVLDRLGLAALLVLEADARQHGAAADVELVRGLAVAHEAELGHVGPPAAVRAARHAHHDLLVEEAEVVHDGADARDHRGHEPLRLGHGEAAERQRGAGHGQPRQRVDGLDRQDAVLGHEPLHRGAVVRRDVRHDDGLRRAQDEVGADLGHAGPQEGPPLRPAVGVVAHAALLAVDAHEQRAVAGRVPAHPVAVAPLLELGDGRDGSAEVALDERAERVLAERVHEVLEARVRAHLAVAVVALGGHDGLERGHELLVREEAERRRRARERRLLAVRPAEAAADVDVRAGEVLLDDDADVVDEDVDGVVALDRHADLELARQVDVPVDGLHRVVEHDAVPVRRAHPLLHLRVDAQLVRLREVLDRRRAAARHRVDEVPLPVLHRRELVAVAPDLAEGLRLRHEELRADRRDGAHAAVGRRRALDHGHGRRHDVSVDVAAAADRRRARLHDRADHVLQVRLGDAVDLEGLARRHAQVPLAEALAEVVEHEVERAGALARGHLEAEHELPGLLGALLALLAVVLLVAPVELEQVVRVVADRDRLHVGQVLDQRVPQVVALELHLVHAVEALDAQPREAHEARLVAHVGPRPLEDHGRGPRAAPRARRGRAVARGARVEEGHEEGAHRRGGYTPGTALAARRAVRAGSSPARWDGGGSVSTAALFGRCSAQMAAQRTFVALPQLPLTYPLR